MDESILIKKLLKIEALFAGATTDGERIAAERARIRILNRLKNLAQEDPPIEYRFSMRDKWSKKVFLALLRRYGLKPYRYYRQRYTTVMVKAPQRFVDETLWPEFKQISDELEIYLAQVTDRIVKTVIHEDSSDAEVVREAKQLENNFGPPVPPPAPPSEQHSTTPKPKKAQSVLSGDLPGIQKPGKKNRKKKKKKKKRRK